MMSEAAHIFLLMMTFATGSSDSRASLRHQVFPSAPACEAAARTWVAGVRQQSGGRVQARTVCVDSVTLAH